MLLWVGAAHLGAAGEAAEFRDLVAGAPAAALGGSVVALPGLEGAAVNPAAIAYQADGALQASHLALVQDVSVEQILLAWPLGFGSVGADLRYLSAPELQGLDATGQPSGASVPTQESSYGLAWAGLWRGLGLGLELNELNLDLADGNGNGWSLDGGLQWALPGGLRLGGSLRNGGWLPALAGQADVLPAEAALGTAWVADVGGNRVQLSAQGLRQGGGDWQGVAGVELGLSGLAFLRASYAPLRPQGQAGPFAGGLGAHLGPVDLDGAWIPYGDLGNTFRFSATLYPRRWNTTTPPPGIRVVAEGKGVYRLSWDAQAEAHGYVLYRRGKPDGPWIRLTPRPLTAALLRIHSPSRGPLPQFGLSVIGPDGAEGPVTALRELR